MSYRVFVASSLDQNPKAWESIRKAVDQRDIRLIYHSAESAPTKTAAQAHVPEIRDAECFLIVQGSAYGPLLKDDPRRSLAHFQTDEAIKLGKRPLLAYALTDEAPYEGPHDARNDLIKTLEKSGLDETNNEDHLFMQLAVAFNWFIDEEPYDEKRIVLVSSTRTDLPTERTVVQQAVGQTLDMKCVMFEDLPRGVDAERTSRRLAQKAAIFLGLLSPYRGTCIPGRDLAYTELEYQEIAEFDIPGLIFEPQSYTASPTRRQSEHDSQMVHSFTERLRKRYGPALIYQSENDLYGIVLNAICKLRDQGMLFTNAEIGQPEQDDVVTPPSPLFVHDYSRALDTKLVGRERELKKLGQWISDPDASHFSARVYCIEAPGGMGKSALAWEWADKLLQNEPAQFEAVIWFSFCAVESGAHEFAETVLPYLSRLKGIDPILAVDCSPLEKVLRILEQRSVLVILDGMERRMRLYTDFRARATEGGELDRMVEALADRRRLAYQDRNEKLARRLAWDDCFRMSEEDALMLRRLACAPKTRTLLTSRFFPSDLLVSAEKSGPDNKQPIPGANRITLEPFGNKKAKQLAKAMQIAWRGEFDQLVESIGGYPLYLALALDYVNRGADSQAKLTSRRGKLRKALQRDKDSSRIAIVTLGIADLNDTQREILYVIEACPIATTFDDLRQTLAANGGAALSPADVVRELELLHSRKLIDWDPNKGSCDMHPVVREAVRLHAAPQVTKRILKAYKSAPSKHPSIRGGKWNSPLIAGALARFNLELRQPDLESAFAFYVKVIDPLFRFLEMDKRKVFLETFQARRAQLSQKAQIEILVRLADTQLLEAQPQDAYALIQRAGDLARQANAPELLRIVAVEKGRAALALGRLVEADSALINAVKQGAVSKSDDAARRALCQKAQLDAEMGRFEQADQIVQLLMRRFREDDVDVLYARFHLELCRAANDDANFAHAKVILEKHRRVCREEGIFVHRLCNVRGVAHLAMLSGDDFGAEDEMNLLLADPAAETFRQERLLLKTKLARLRIRHGHVSTVEKEARRLQNDAAEKGLRQIEAEAWLGLAEAAWANANKQDALQYANQASSLANADGHPYSYGLLAVEIRKFFETIGQPMSIQPQCGPDMLARIPRMPDIPRPKARPIITDTKGWADERIIKLLEELKTTLDWENTTNSARKWWEAFENNTEHRRVLRLAEELAMRKATITELFLAYVHSNTDNIQANLHYLDYTRLKKWEGECKKGAAANSPRPEKPKRDGPNPLPDEITDARNLADESITELIQQTKEQLDWEGATGSAKKWWETFESKNKHRLVLRLAEELAIRKATITEFFLAYRYSNTDNIQTNLHYLDYTMLKKSR